MEKKTDRKPFESGFVVDSVTGIMDSKYDRSSDIKASEKLEKCYDELVAEVLKIKTIARELSSIESCTNRDTMLASSLLEASIEIMLKDCGFQYLLDDFGNYLHGDSEFSKFLACVSRWANSNIRS